MKVWVCNWASLGDAECVRDDGIVDTEFLATPYGVVLGDIANIATVHKLVEDDLRETYEEDFVEETWQLRENASRDGYREYTYGEDTLLICVQKDVL